MYLPNLTAYHTLENSQGTLDPLGLYSIADQLAGLLAPNLRERMKHPRYLTPIAVGAVVCSKFGDDDVAADGISPAWQVYEWYVASAFVKTFEKADKDQLFGMPARLKATNAMRESVPLSANRYLKTPGVFGFHGVYRTLARGIGLLDGNGIGEFGVRLIDVWEREQNLDGFRVGRKGTTGGDFRAKLEDAVSLGMKSGKVEKPWSWNFYATLAEVMAPKSPGKAEADIIFQQLLKGETSSRADLIKFLISKDGQQALSDKSERTVHEKLLLQDVSNRQVLLAIQSYERVARLLYNAFYEMLHWMEKHNCKGTVIQLAELASIKKACNELRDAFNQASLRLEPFIAVLVPFTNNFQLVQQTYRPLDWVKLLFEHHMKVQKNKPPNGKASWVLEHSSGTFLLNTAQALVQILNDEYVHQYRSFSLQSFMKDLGKL